MPDFTLCTYHDMCIKELNKVAKKLENNPDKNIEVDIILDVLDNIKEARKCGKSMEKRLKKYRTGIEGLGFERVKKNSKYHKR